MFKSSAKFTSILDKSYLSNSTYSESSVLGLPILYCPFLLQPSRSHCPSFPFRRKALVVIQDELRSEKPLRALALLRLAKWVLSFSLLSQVLSNQNNRRRIFNIEICLTWRFHESVTYHSKASQGSWCSLVCAERRADNTSVSLNNFQTDLSYRCVSLKNYTKVKVKLTTIHRRIILS